MLVDGNKRVCAFSLSRVLIASPSCLVSTMGSQAQRRGHLSKTHTFQSGRVFVRVFHHVYNVSTVALGVQLCLLFLIMFRNVVPTLFLNAELDALVHK